MRKLKSILSSIVSGTWFCFHFNLKINTSRSKLFFAKIKTTTNLKSIGILFLDIFSQFINQIGSRLTIGELFPMFGLIVIVKHGGPDVGCSWILLEAGEDWRPPAGLTCILTTGLSWFGAILRPPWGVMVNVGIEVGGWAPPTKLDAAVVGVVGGGPIITWN